MYSVSGHHYTSFLLVFAIEISVVGSGGDDEWLGGRGGGGNASLDTLLFKTPIQIRATSCLERCGVSCTQLALKEVHYFSHKCLGVLRRLH